MLSTASVIALAGLVASVSAHGEISSPKARAPGTAMEAACGTQVYDNQNSDSYGNVQAELQVASSQSDYNAAECNLWLCKGYTYADNTANVQSYTAGQVIPIEVTIHAPHTGTANVSIVDTATNTMISDELIYFDVYASTSTSIPANNTAFSITMPSNLGSKCDTAGACVIQWYWNAASIDQTYESCIDFTLGGSDSSSASASASTVATSSAAVVSSSAVAATSSVAATTSAASSAAAASATSSVGADNVVTVHSTTTMAGASSSSTSCYTPSTLVTSVASAKVAIATATGIASSVLTATVAATGATSTVSAAAGSVAAMPSGTTLEDILSWLNTYIQELVN